MPPKYRRRERVSRPCSGWERVGHRRYDHQKAHDRPGGDTGPNSPHPPPERSKSDSGPPQHAQSVPTGHNMRTAVTAQRRLRSALPPRADTIPPFPALLALALPPLRQGERLPSPAAEKALPPTSGRESAFPPGGRTRAFPHVREERQRTRRDRQYTKALGHLVRVSSTPHSASTPRLSTR